MRILHVISNASGGAAMSTVSLMAALHEHGVASAAVCHSAGRHQDRQAILDATQGHAVFTGLHSWNRKFRSPWPARIADGLKSGVRTGWGRRSAKEVAAFARQAGADLIHTNTIMNPEGGLAARALQVPHVWHLRELVGPRDWFRLPLSGAALGRFLQTRCAVLVANSEAAASRVRDGMPDGLLTVVPNGIDVARFGPVGEPRPGPVVVAMVGNLGSHVKKHALFIDAAALLPPSLPLEFRIYGAVADGDYVAGLKARVSRHRLESRMRFMGHATDPAQMMREIDVLVHPADLESFGRIAVEAMASHVPVVGVRGGGIAEIVDDGVTGLLAEPDDAADIAAKIQWLAEDANLRRAMGDAGRRRAETHYSLDQHVSRMLGVYERAMQHPRSR